MRRGGLSERAPGRGGRRRRAIVYVSGLCGWEVVMGALLGGCGGQSVGRSGGCRARVWLVFVGGFSVVLGYSVVVGLVEGFRGEVRTWVTCDVQQTGPRCCR